MKCEVCNLDVQEEISFYDNIQKKDVAYHRDCYAKGFNAVHALVDEEKKEQFLKGEL